MISDEIRAAANRHRLGGTGPPAIYRDADDQMAWEIALGIRDTTGALIVVPQPVKTVRHRTKPAKHNGGRPRTRDIVMYEVERIAARRDPNFAPELRAELGPPDLSPVNVSAEARRLWAWLHPMESEPTELDMLIDDLRSKNPPESYVPIEGPPISPSAKDDLEEVFHLLQKGVVGTLDVIRKRMTRYLKLRNIPRSPRGRHRS